MGAGWKVKVMQGKNIQTKIKSTTISEGPWICSEQNKNLGICMEKCDDASIPSKLFMCSFTM